jgi:intracellular sulfur oxidation DsrE/DsrF family protein
MTDESRDRRTILGWGAAVLGAGALTGAARAETGEPGAVSNWRPSPEAQDGWMDKPGTRHRLMFDTTVATAAQSAMFYADTYYAANKSGYGLSPDALGVIIVLRHLSTPFGMNDVVWAKYGRAIAEKLKLEGAQAIAATERNPLLSNNKGANAGSDQDVTLMSLAGRGARFAVCGMAAHAMALQFAKQLGKDAAAIEFELTHNLIPGAVLVPAGIVAVDRAQEHGYAFAYIPD